MIDFKIKKWIKNNIAPYDATRAYKSMLRKYNALTVHEKEKFESEIDEDLNINQGIVKRQPKDNNE